MHGSCPMNSAGGVGQEKKEKRKKKPDTDLNVERTIQTEL